MMYIKFFKWCLGLFQEDSTKPSQKRLIAFILALVLCFRAIQPTPEIELLITLFSFIAVLLGFTYIPTRK